MARIEYKRWKRWDPWKKELKGNTTAQITQPSSFRQQTLQHDKFTHEAFQTLSAQLKSSATFSSLPAKWLTALCGPILRKRASGLKGYNKWLKQITSGPPWETAAVCFSYPYSIHQPPSVTLPGRWHSNTVTRQGKPVAQWGDCDYVYGSLSF